MKYLYSSFLFYLFISSSGIAQQDIGNELIGTKAPKWTNLQWINSSPLSLSSLKGKVVLIRWWTEECPFCEATGPALNTFHQQYRSKGLRVIGMYHPKPHPQLISKKKVQNFVHKKGFQFPIGLDLDWENLNQYWLNQVGRAFTSVSFLIDKKGVIRYIHPGGAYHKDGSEQHSSSRSDYFEIDQKIKQLLAE